MTTQQIRSQITVTNWSMNESSLTVSYFRSTEENSKELHLLLSLPQALEALDNIGSVTSPFLNPSDTLAGTYLKGYKISQWDALSIAIRHEYGNDLKMNTALIEMDAAVAALKSI